MNLIKQFTFDDNLYELKNIFCITSKDFFEGGFDINATLEEKHRFYKIALEYSRLLKEMAIKFEDNIIIGKDISEKYIFEEWSDLKKYDAFNNICNTINKKQTYMLDIPKDFDIIDYIIECDFRYFTNIDFYFQKMNLIVQPTCHTEFFLFSDDYSSIISSIKEILQNFPSLELKEYDNSFCSSS